MVDINPIEYSNKILEALKKKDLTNFILKMKDYFYDKNTKLFSKNMWSFFMEGLKKDDSSKTMAFLDVNYLKEANDNYGYDAGDIYINIVIDLMRLTMSHKDDTAIRFGGDEFLIIYDKPLEVSEKKIGMLKQITNLVNNNLTPFEISEYINENYSYDIDIETLSNICTLYNSLNTVYNTKGQEFKISFAIGYGEYDNGLDIKEFIDNIEQEMYENKKIIKKESNINKDKKVQIVSDKCNNVSVVELDKDNNPKLDTLTVHSNVEYLVKSASCEKHSEEISLEKSTHGIPYDRKIEIIKAILNNNCTFFSDMEPDELIIIANMLKKEITIDSVTGLIKKEITPYFLNTDKAANRNVMILDVDGLKKLNDIKGHCMGDQLLIVLVNILNASYTDESVLIRYGGDEIVIIYDNNEMEENMNQYIEEFNSSDMADNFKLSISYATELFDTNVFKTPEMLTNQLDKEMHINKAERKARENKTSIITDEQGDVIGVWDDKIRGIALCENHIKNEVGVVCNVL
ncbi:MAG: hypothetical protein A2Y18_04035 [Clostridiales bacterium GWD2_32_19]|nr:MAG: hypothetical protein A2Y18_04035 [Clostridiales bacterium GWD2_32_19]